MSIRPVKRVVQSTPTLEGAGVHLRRAFGFGATSEFDPFLLLDDFRNDDPGRLSRRVSVASAPRHRNDHVRAGRNGRSRRQPRESRQPRRGRRAMDDGGEWHPASGDAQGRPGGAGCTASSSGANLPSSLKMTRPRYQDVSAGDIPEVIDADGTRVRVVCGSFWGKTGPVDGVAADPRYLDVFVPPGVRKRLAVETSRNAFAYVFEGAGAFRDASEPRAVQTDRVSEADATDTTAAIANRSLVVFESRRRGRGSGGRGRYPVPARLRAADRGARGVARPHRHEHDGAAPAGLHRTARRERSSSKTSTPSEDASGRHRTYVFIDRGGNPACSRGSTPRVTYSAV